MSSAATEQPCSLPSVVFNWVFIKDTKPFSSASTNPVGHLTALQAWWGAAGRSPTSTALYNIYVAPEWRWTQWLCWACCQSLLAFSVFLMLGLFFKPVTHLGWIKANWNMHSQKQQNQHKYSINSKVLYEQNKFYGISICIVDQEANKPAFICT